MSDRILAQSYDKQDRNELVCAANWTIKAATVEPGRVLLLFDDESRMKIKTAGPATIRPGGKVKSVHEAEFKIDFEDGSSATLCLADPGSSVAVRDKNNAVEYLG
jgi:hypothetical protein